MNINIGKRSLIFALAVSVIILGGVAAFAPNSPLKLKIPSISFNNPSSENIVSSKTDVPLYKPVIDYEQAVTDAVEKASPSVVSIIISKDLPVIEQCPYNPYSDLPQEFQQFFGEQFQFSQPCQSGKTQRQEIGGGSGFVISKDGLVATNKHVVFDSAASYTVLTNDGEKYDAEILAQHPTLDIAILKIKVPAEGLRVPTLGDSDSIKLGQTVIVIGNALGEFRNTVSVGVVSGLSRTVTAGGEGIGEETIEGVIQTDAAINPGNSGGPLLNLKGEVIGINTAMVSGAQNIGFALPINQVKKAIESVKATGKISVSYLGVRFLTITEDLAQKEKLPVENGVLLRGNADGPAVLPDSPAQKAGLQAEDIITEFNGEKIDQNHSLTYLIQKYNVGEKISLKILRNEKEMTLQATLEERPKQ